MAALKRLYNGEQRRTEPAAAVIKVGSGKFEATSSCSVAGCPASSCPVASCPAALVRRRLVPAASCPGGKLAAASCHIPAFKSLLELFSVEEHSLSNLKGVNEFPRKWNNIDPFQETLCSVLQCSEQTTLIADLPDANGVQAVSYEDEVILTHYKTTTVHNKLREKLAEVANCDNCKWASKQGKQYAQQASMGSCWHHIPVPLRNTSFKNSACKPELSGPVFSDKTVLPLKNGPG
ncbi:hypothetical protein M514_02437 [Trichuris suis]|uniref:Uncharacterized protein n=1 Tax=Trichuris suis TaxID=68888 RepID=A0A085N5P0_9BILA|nr:hypothetical protein M513_02437 [Trichuris suis]KFD64786.1 hypothetical protein M514_02437 [Trichuris suis]